MLLSFVFHSTKIALLCRLLCSTTLRRITTNCTALIQLRGTPPSACQVMGRMKPMAGARLKVQYNRNDSHMVVADSQRLHQVVHVAMVNAFKYTRKVNGECIGGGEVGWGACCKALSKTHRGGGVWCLGACVGACRQVEVMGKGSVAMGFSRAHT